MVPDRNVTEESLDEVTDTGEDNLVGVECGPLRPCTPGSRYTPGDSASPTPPSAMETFSYQSYSENLQLFAILLKRKYVCICCVYIVVGLVGFVECTIMNS